MKRLFLTLLIGCAAGHAESLSFGSVLDPAPDAFCTDAAHPICLKLTQIQFTGLPVFPSIVDIEDRNGDFVIYDFSNIVVNVDPGGLTYSGSVTPSEAFSITNAENADFQQGLLYLGVLDSNGNDVIGTNFTQSSIITPEPNAAALLLAGLTAAGLTNWRRLLRRTK
jgi:hypothetical protein